MRQSILFNGRWYHRYPNAKQSNHRKYYSSHARWKETPLLLHREVWEFHNGPIPDGHHVHHIDGNPDNNDISNLICLAESAHQLEHREEASRRSSAPEHLEHLARIREKTKAWHASPEGREWHRQHALRSITKEYPEQACLICGTMYRPKINRPGMCSEECKRTRRNNLQRSGWRKRSSVRSDG